MPQVIVPTQQRHQPSFLQSVMGGLAQGVGPAIQQYQSMKQQQAQQQTNEQKELRQFQQQIELQKQKYDFEKELANQKLSGSKKEETDLLNKTFSRLEELVPDLGRGSGIYSLVGGKTAEKSAEFTSIMAALESSLVERVNKGTLTNTRFKYITETLLPKPTDTQAEIKGKLKGIKAMLNVEGTGEKDIQEKPKERLPLTSFHR